MRQKNMKVIAPALGVSVLAVSVMAVGGDRTRQDRDERRSSVVQRQAESRQSAREWEAAQRERRQAHHDRRREWKLHRRQRRNSGWPPLFPNEFRTVDGFGNNETNPEWGATGVPFRRLTPVTYGNGLQTPAGADRPDVRTISNALCNQTESQINSAGASAFLWQWGQFLDHDITETPVASPTEEFDIAIPSGDPWFDLHSTGGLAMPLDRSAYVVIDNVRQQINNITAYIDASMIYGADDSRAAELRTFDGAGRLKTSAGDLLPFNVNGLPNAPTPHDPSFMLAGDIRANEQIGLTAMHTLFVREHNYWADRIAQRERRYSDEDIYQRAKAIVTAEIQAITYREFLPLLLGGDALPAYAGYDATVDAGIANVFATAAFRVGHTMLSSPMMRLDADMKESPAGHLPLAQAFFNPSHIVSEGIDSTLRGQPEHRAPICYLG